jgi:hypothetical protein
VGLTHNLTRCHPEAAETLRDPPVEVWVTQAQLRENWMIGIRVADAILDNSRDPPPHEGSFAVFAGSG